MRISLEQWQTIADAKRHALAAINEYENVLIDTLLTQTTGSREDAILREILGMADDALFNLQRHDVTPQEEWVGGNSMNPKNFKYREPHCVGIGSAREYLEKS